MCSSAETSPKLLLCLIKKLLGPFHDRGHNNEPENGGAKGNQRKHPVCCEHDDHNPNKLCGGVKQVSDALDKMRCTRIVIAHRLSTIRHCDRIVVLDKGKIVEDGTYEELIALDGYFAELVSRQRMD